MQSMNMFMEEKQLIVTQCNSILLGKLDSRNDHLNFYNKMLHINKLVYITLYHTLIKTKQHQRSVRFIS